MRKRRNWQLFSTYILGLLIGLTLAFGDVRGTSSQALAVALPTSVINQAGSFLALVPPGQGSFVADAIERTGAAVVRIDTERTVTRRTSALPDELFNDPFFREFFGDRFRQLPQEQERQLRGQGSGFIINEQGIVLTNAHVVSQADRVTITLRDSRTFEGEVRGTDEVTDLAVVKIMERVPDLPVAALGNSDSLKVGDWAIAVGNPVGLNNTVTLGIISTLARSSAQVGIPDKRVDFLQTDAAINPGNSGGPLLNDRGDVIGINTAIRPGANGIGFAIPINKAKALINTLAAGKAVPHPFVGIQMVGITAEEAQENNADPNSMFIVPEIDGVLVVRVIPDTPAAAAGIRRGDVITKVDGQAIADAGKLQSLVDRSGIGKTLKFTLVRGERTLTIPVTTAQLSNQGRS
ncbi:MAG: HhoA/HhoB/HtrA family serine endopeptidase [Cyanobacteria bacterium P01_H01_bin.15]